MFLKSSFCKLALVIGFSIGFVSATVSAQIAQPERQTLDMRLPSVSFPAGKSFVEVPFEISGNWMLIPVSINGSRPLRFVLDTGAQGTFLNNSEIAGSLNLKIVGKMQIRFGAFGNALRVRRGERFRRARRIVFKQPRNQTGQQVAANAILFCRLIDHGERLVHALRRRQPFGQAQAAHHAARVERACRAVFGFGARRFVLSCK